MMKSVRGLLAGTAVAVLTIALATSAQAQERPQGEAQPVEGAQDQGVSPVADSEGDNQTLIVTGTQIRGTAPVGTNVISLGEEDVVASGATSANGVLATIPQITTNFNRVRALGAGGSGITNLSPNIRNIGAAGGTTTLVLLDGHRFVNAGVLSTSPDPDVIPPAVLQRVEVVPDGGSSIYGSDAVGGVINFVTLRRFDGVEATARYGIADDYQSVDLSLIAGSDWGSGSAYLSYAYAWHDDIFGRDRDFVQQVPDNGGQCGAGTVFSGATSFALPDRVPGTITDCDYTDDATFYPRETRHAVFGSLTQELGSAITFELRGFYATRRSIATADPENNGSGGGGQAVVICSPALGAAACAAVGGVVFPGYVPVAGDTGVQRVAFNYGGLINNSQPNALDAFQVTPAFTVDLGADWQLRLLGSYGESTTDTSLQSVNGTRQAQAIAAGTLNPYDPRSSSPAAVGPVFDNFVGSGSQDLLNARAVVDGSLFQLPAGAIRLAAGAEYLRESINDVVFGFFVPGTESTGTPIDASRHVESVFAEVVVPVFSEQNSGLHSLTLSASARYDHYSDFGGTFNPKLGFTFEPVEWFRVRGNWGESFNAPSLADTNAPDTRSFTLPAFLLARPGTPIANPAQQSVFLVGGNVDLGPQTADTWSIGFDIDPPFLPGLSLSATYYNIRLTDQIAVPPISPVIYTPAYSDFAVLNPTQAQVEAAVTDAAPYLGPPVSSLYTATYGPYALLDFRRQNLGDVRQDGIDFNLRYRTDTSFGSINAGFAGTYTLNRKVAAVAGGELTDLLESPGESAFSFVASVGAEVGHVVGALSWNHSSGYDLDPPITTNRFGTQTRVGSFNPVDLYLEYRVGGEGLLDDLSFTLNVENIFDEDPPFYNVQNGFTNGSTLGRQVLVGVRKRF